MSRASPKRRAEVAPEEPARTLPRPPTKEEFEAECAALTNAVVQTLETDLRTKMATPPGREAAAAEPHEAVLAGPKPTHYPGELDFVPPYHLILQHIAAGAKAGDRVGEVSVSRQFLEFLLRAVIGQMDFDEQQYQICNPDVAAAIKQKKVHSGHEHFVRAGYFEGRSGGVPVDEAWYLARNPDVVSAKKAGKLASGAAQYRLAGASEWRVPNPRSEEAIRAWKAVLTR